MHRFWAARSRRRTTGPNAPLVAVLSHALWQRRFGGDPGAIGRVVQFNDRPVEIIGVMPAGFRFVDQDNDMWTASRLDRHQPWRETSGRFINVVARLKPGATMSAARAEMTGLARAARGDVYVQQEHDGDAGAAARGADRPGATSLLVLYAAVGILLSIACFNVANLLLARAASRRREIAIRTSLGAGRLAIVRQLLVESLLLAMAGGALGIALARWSLDALLAFAPADLLRVSELSSIDACCCMRLVCRS